MQFKVPQFIDIEDKIFGPLTFKEFVYLVGGGALCYVLYQLLPFIVAMFVILPVGALSLALAFYKVNGKPFIKILEASIRYLFQSKLYLWKKEYQKEEKEKKTVPTKPLTVDPRLSQGKLKDIAWSLDILDAKKQNEKQG